MADSVRQKIMDNILTRLKTMSEDNGYSEDYVTVCEWRMYPFEDAELPAVVIEDKGTGVINYNDFKTDYKLDLMVIVVLRGSETPEALRNIIQDVYKCLGADLTCGGNARSIEPVEEVIELSHKEDLRGIVSMLFSVEYVCKSWDLITLS